MDAFQGVGDAQPQPVRGGEVQHRQPLWDGGLGPFGEFGVLRSPSTKAVLSSRSASDLSGALKIARRLEPRMIIGGDELEAMRLR